MSRPKDINSPSPWNMRIWDVDKGEWLCESDKDALPYYGFDIRGGEVAFIQGMEWVYRDSLQEGHPLIWERSTGIKDKNGVEIYEGDLVDWLSPLDGYIHFAVEWGSSQARFYLHNPNSDYDYESVCDKKSPYLRVIGNIHEPVPVDKDCKKLKEQEEDEDDAM